MNCTNLILHLNIHNSRNGLGRFLNLFHIKRYRLEGLRTLYSPSHLGLDGFSKLTMKIKEEYGDTNSFLNRLERLEFENKDIYAEDLKVLIACCSEDRSLVGDTIKFYKRYNDNVKDLNLQPYLFGPWLMRLFYIHDSVDEALQLVLDEKYGKSFNQISSYHVLMNKLFEMEKYEEIKFLLNVIISEELFEIPWSCLTLAMAANYKIGTEEALGDSMRLIHLIIAKRKRVHVRTNAFAAGLALKLKKPDVTIEILEYSQMLTHFLLSNLRVLAKARLGCINDVLAILKSKALNEIPVSIPSRKAFCYDVLKEVEEIVNETEDIENMAQIKHFKSVFQSSNLISNQSLEEAICSPIQDRSTEMRKKRNIN